MFISKASAYTPERILKQNTSKDVFSGKEVHFGVFDCIKYLNPYISETTAILGTGFDCTVISTENRFNMQTTWIVIVAP